MGLQVIVKPTSACNAKCTYCSATAQARGGVLRAEQLGALFEPFAKWLRDRPHERLSFVWHGGEPMLLGPSYYETAQAEQERLFGDDVARVRNQMQTNLTLIDESWVPILTSFIDGGMSTSFDFVDGVRDLRNGMPLPEVWMRAVDVCRKAGIPIGVVYVVHRQSLPLAAPIFHFFKNMGSDVRVRLNPLYAAGRAGTSLAEPLAITPEEYGRFMLQICDLWIADFRRTRIFPLQEWYDAWGGQHGKLCCDSRGNCDKTHLGVSPNGDVFGCGRGSDAKRPEEHLGNVFQGDRVDDMLQRPARQELSTRGEVLLKGHCGGCPYWSVCHGGCPQLAKLYTGTVLSPTHFCSGRKMVYEWFEARWGTPAPEPEPVAASVAHADCPTCSVP